MKAKQTKPDQENARNLAHKKETVQTTAIVCLHKGELVEVISCRWYKSRARDASVVYCSLWVYGAARDNYSSGHGDAHGCGRDKYSVSLNSAIKSAGWTLYGTPYSGRKAPNDDAALAARRVPCNIAGAGMGAISKALKALARGAGYRGKLIEITT